MARQEARALTPRLRFPEFREAAAWEEKTLVNAAQCVTQGGTPDTSVPEYWNGEIAWITPAEMGKSDDPRVGSTVRRITEEGLQACSSELLPVRSVIISTRAPIGHLAINTVPMAINQGCKGIVPGAGLDHRFLFASLLLAKLRLMDLGAGNTFKELSASALKSFKIALPARAEQQKIADCLTSLDEVIAAQGRKVVALKAHKRGLMQQLFPREGETRPRLRFPEFRNAPEWKLTTLGQVCEMQAGKFVSASEISDEPDEGTYPCYGGNGLRGFTKSFTHAGVFPLIGRQGALCGNVQFATGEFHATEHALVANPQTHVDATWLYYALGKLELNQYATGQAQPGLSVDVLKSVECTVPETESEQQRIADCLTSLDTHITVETAQLAALKTHKQGLMQQLFPAPEAMGA